MLTNWNCVRRNPFFRYLVKWRWGSAFRHPFFVSLFLAFGTVFLFKLSISIVFPIVLPLIITDPAHIRIAVYSLLFALYITACMAGFSMQFMLGRQKLRELSYTGRLEQFLSSGRTVPVTFGLTFPYTFSAQMMGIALIVFHCAFFVRDVEFLAIYGGLFLYAIWMTKKNGPIIAGEDIRLIYGNLGDPLYLRGILSAAALYIAGWLCFIIPLFVIIFVLPIFFEVPEWLQRSSMQFVIAIMISFSIQKFVLVPLQQRAKARLRHRWGGMDEMMSSTMENAVTWGRSNSEK